MSNAAAGASGLIDRLAGCFVDERRAESIEHTVRTLIGHGCGTIRLRLLKIGAVVTVSVRRVKLAMSEVCPNQREFITACHDLSAAAS